MRFPEVNPDVIHGVIRLDKADSPFIADFEADLSRLERLAHLGLVAEVYRSARYSKLEHTFGIYHLVATHAGQIPLVKGKDARTTVARFRKLALIHALGRLPLTFATEGSLADAAEQEPTVRSTVIRWVNKVRKRMECRQCNELDAIHLACHEPRRLHRWIAAVKLLRNADRSPEWRQRWNLDDDGLRDLLRMLACRHHDIAHIFRRLDAFDYVPRDFHYSALGTLDLNLDSAIASLGAADTAEARFLSLTEEYLSERLYAQPTVALLERLVRKLVANHLTAGHIKPTKLIEYDDNTLKIQLNRSYRHSFPTLDEIVADVIGDRWLFLSESKHVDNHLVAEAEHAASYSPMTPFTEGIVIVPPEPRRRDTPAAVTSARVYVHNSAKFLPAAARLLRAVETSREGALAAEGPRSWARPLALDISAAILSPGNTMTLHSQRLIPTARTLLGEVLEQLNKDSQSVLNEVVEHYCEEHSLESPVAIAGVPFFAVANPCISNMLGARLLQVGGDESANDPSLDLLARCLIEEPRLLPQDIVDELLTALQTARDQPREDVHPSIPAELREYLLEDRDLPGCAWAYPPCLITAQDGTIIHELDGIRLQVTEDNQLKLAVFEVSLSETEEKAAADITKAARLVAAARRRGADVSLQRVAPREAAPFRVLR